MTTICLIFLLLVIYQLKHFLADYPLQNEYMLGKFKPGWDFIGPLLSHASVHFIFTTLISTGVLVYFNHAAPLGFGMLIGFGDSLIHFTMDRIKAGPKYMGRWKPLTASEFVKWKGLLWPKDVLPDSVQAYDSELAERALRGNTLFWVSIGFDQLVHHLTDITSTYVVLKLSGVL